MSRIIVPTSRMEMGMKGFFRFQCINKFSGKVTQDTGWFPNTILNAGRDIMATRSDWLNWCQVGTNGTFPSTLGGRQSETALGAWHAGTNSVVSTTNGQAGSAPYYGWKRKTFRFDVGTVNANLSEAGVGWGVGGPATDDTLISRAPILDPVLGTPTTVTPLADELLDVSYELRYYPPLVDVAGPQVTLFGTVYDTLTRAGGVTGGAWSAYIGTAIGQRSISNGDWYATDGDIGTILTGPSGVSASCDNANQYNSGYSLNSYEIKMNCYSGATGWSLGSGIRSLRVNTTAGEYQTQFNAAVGGARIPKTVALFMQMAWILGWSEYVAP